MNSLERDRVLRENLKKKLGFNNFMEHREVENIKSYEEALEEKDLKSMIKNKVYKNSIKIKGLREKLERLDINDLVRNEKVLERQLEGIKEKRIKEVEELEKRLNNSLVEEAKEVKNQMSKMLVAEKYNKFFKIEEENINKKYEDVLLDLNLELGVTSELLEEFEVENEKILNEIDNINQKRKLMEYKKVKNRYKD